MTYDLQGTTLQTFALQSQSSVSYVRIQVRTRHAAYMQLMHATVFLRRITYELAKPLK